MKAGYLLYVLHIFSFGFRVILYSPLFASLYKYESLKFMPVWSGYERKLIENFSDIYG